MGYFEGVSSLYIKKDGEGRAVFYPWGVFGKGYVLPDEARESGMRRFLKTYTITVIAAFAITAAFGLGWLIAALVGAMAWFFLAVKRMLKGCPVSAEKMTFRESYSNAGRSHNAVTLWVLLLISLFFTFIGFFLAWRGYPAPQSAVMGLAGLIFGALSAAYVYMLKVKLSRPG